MKKTKNNTFRTSEVVFLIIITCVLSFSMAMLITKSNKEEPTQSSNAKINKFIEQYENVINNYYDKVDEDKLIDGAIKGMIMSLEDPYATYFDENEANNFNIKLSGEYEGLGVEIIKLEDNKVYILNIFENSNAYKSDLKVGDIIVSVDGIKLSDITTEEFVNIVKRSGKVLLEVERDGKTFKLSISTSSITLKSVSSKVLEQDNKKIGYVKIDIFALNTYEQLKSELEKLEKENISSLIIDVRDNPGGHLSSVEDVLSLFLNNDKIIYQLKKQNTIEKINSKGSADKKYKIVILVNDQSASASELMTAALQEQLGAIVIGKTTYGKSAAQDLVTLSTGEQYKFTTKEWLTPKGNSINGVGITPSSECDGDACIDKALAILK